MKVYSYDKNGFYIGISIAQPNPMQSSSGNNAFLIPANATTIEPPNEVTGKKAQWTSTGIGQDQGSWSLVDDPQIIVQQKMLRSQNQVVFFRQVSGKDTAVISLGRYGSGILYNGLPMSDPSNAQIGALEVGSDISGADEKNQNGIPVKKVVQAAVVDRDPNDIFLDDVVAQSQRILIFYRNRGGNIDTAVLQALTYREATSGGVLLFQGKPLSDPINALVAYIQSDLLSVSDVMTVSENGVPTNAVINGQLVARDPAAIARDYRNGSVYKSQANLAIIAALAGTGPSNAPDAFYILTLVHCFSAVVNLSGTETADSMNQAKQTLAPYLAAFSQIEQIQTSLAQQLSQLEAAS
jgi:hypothetical protein